MTGSLQASVLFLPQFFTCLLLLAATRAFANPDNVSNALLKDQLSSIQLTLSKQADTDKRLEARSSPLGQILKAIADKTAAIIHSSELLDGHVIATCVDVCWAGHGLPRRPRATKSLSIPRISYNSTKLFNTIAFITHR
jgi:hypothetical protein